MVMGPGGTLYGTTTAGGRSNNGTVFSLTPPASPGGPWTESVLYSFAGAPDGALPVGSLLMGPRGTLYGTTVLGGFTDANQTYGFGTVFALTPPVSAAGAWREEWLYRVQPRDESAGDLVIGGDETLYGVFFGDQAFSQAFSLSPAGEETITTTGASGVVIGGDGTIYGTSALGGEYGQGAFFSLNPPASTGGAWTQTLLYSFVGQEAFPTGPALGPGGVIYALSPGDGYTDGAIFSLTPPASPGGAWTEDLLYSLNLSYSYGQLAIDGRGVLYSVTGGNGTGNCPGPFGEIGCGTVYSLTPPATPGNAWTYTVLYNFTGGSDGGFPNGLIIGPHGELYGTTSDEGSSYGTVFSLTP
jgi:uncharacterized repeat protein (TIGR03803 family)